MAASESGAGTCAGDAAAPIASAVHAVAVSGAEPADVRRGEARGPRPGATMLALLPAVCVLSMWLHSARYSASYTWHPGPERSRTIASTSGVIRLAELRIPADLMAWGEPGPTVERKFPLVEYRYLESRDRRTSTEVLTVSYWVPLILSIIPAALAARRRRPAEVDGG